MAGSPPVPCSRRSFLLSVQPAIRRQVAALTRTPALVCNVCKAQERASCLLICVDIRTRLGRSPGGRSQISLCQEVKQSIAAVQHV